MKFIRFLKDYWRDLTPREMIQRELAEAAIQLLEAESGAEYAQSIISFNQIRIKRLTTRLGELT
jgi:hypothetical protein